MTSKQKAALAVLFDHLEELAASIDGAPAAAEKVVDDLGAGPFGSSAIVSGYLRARCASSATELRTLVSYTRQAFPSIRSLFTKKVA